MSGYEVTLSKEQPDSEFAFKVLYATAPEMPGKRWAGSQPYYILAAKPPSPDVDGWSWIGLSVDEKDAIGEALMGCSFAIRGEWLWCLLYKTA
jgi:hypothetical protein